MAGPWRGVRGGILASFHFIIEVETLKVDMKLDPALIRSERQKRGWSQEQLAAAAGLGVRTIQRLEATGVTSNESIKALAAVFEVPFTALLSETPARRRTFHLKWAAIAGAAIVALTTSLLLATRANAGATDFLVLVDSEMSGISRMNLEGEDGQRMEIRFEKELRLVLTPKTLKDDSVLISVELYGWEDGNYKVASTPRVLTRKGSETKLQLHLNNGKKVMLGVTPKAPGA